jgi:predicted alpha/beta hydrolase
VANDRLQPIPTSSLNSRLAQQAERQLDAFADDEAMCDSHASEDYHSIGGGQQTDVSSVLKVNSIWVSLSGGEQLHLRHFVPAAETPNQHDVAHFSADLLDRLTDSHGQPRRSVFMLHGEAECGRIFYDDSNRGLARYLAGLGYEVFVADLGGRGRSLVPDQQQSSLTVHDLITEAIPALLQSAAQHSVVVTNTQQTAVAEAFKPCATGPDVWVAHGFGAVLLSAAWARMPESQRCAKQWVFFNGRRRFSATQRIAGFCVKLFCHSLTEKLVSWRNLFPATRLGLGTADENASWYRTYASWMNGKSWCGDDGFDYHAALLSAKVPPTLHLAAASDKVFSNLVDVRNFIHELGPHDARLLVVDQIAASKRRYNHLSMLLDQSAEQDLFAPLQSWLTQAQAPMLAKQASAKQDSVIAPVLVESAYNKPISQADLSSIDSGAGSLNAQAAMVDANAQKPSLKESMEKLSLHGKSEQLAVCL